MLKKLPKKSNNNNNIRNKYNDINNNPNINLNRRFQTYVKRLSGKSR